MKAKILLLGPMGSGKTKICNYLAGISDKTIPDEIRPTKGVRILEIELVCKINNNEVHVDIQLWDCSGDEQYSGCWPALRKDVNGIIFVYSENDSIAVRKLDNFYEYFVKENDFPHKKCIVMSNQWETEDESSVARISSIFSRISQVSVNVETKGEKFKQIFNQFLTNVISSMQ